MPPLTGCSLVTAKFLLQMGETQNAPNSTAMVPVHVSSRPKTQLATVAPTSVGSCTLQNTGARLKLHNRREGGERELQIEGTPTQATAARTLVEAFLKAAGVPPLVC